MTFLFLSLASSVGIFIFFKLFSIWGLKLDRMVTINYLGCTVTGIIFYRELLFVDEIQVDVAWMPFSLMMGSLFILTFNLMGKTTANYGISIASITTKLSLLFPVALAVFFIPEAEFNSYTLLALLLSIPAIVLASLKGRGIGTKALGILPVGVFILSGFIDGGINYLNFVFSGHKGFQLFPLTVFFCAASIGVIIQILKGSAPWTWRSSKEWAAGIGLGVVNYFSIEFLLRGLDAYNNNGALVYPFLNVGIILFSALTGRMLFREHLSRQNMIGLFLALICLFLIYLAS